MKYWLSCVHGALQVSSPQSQVQNWNGHIWWLEMSNISFFAYSINPDMVRKAKLKFFKLNLLLNSKLKTVLYL